MSEPKQIAMEDYSLEYLASLPPDPRTIEQRCAEFKELVAKHLAEMPKLSEFSELILGQDWDEDEWLALFFMREVHLLGIGRQLAKAQNRSK